MKNDPRSAFLVFPILLLLAGCGGDVSTVTTISTGNTASTPGPAPAVIIAQPGDQNVVEGAAATFSVAASNATGYQWQRSTSGGAAFANVAGASASSYTTPVTAVTDSGTQYRVVVSGAGASITSSAATLRVRSGQATLTSLAVSPSATVIKQGGFLWFTLTGTFSDNTAQDLTRAGAWTSSDRTTVNITTDGIAWGTGTGTAIISVLYSGMSRTASVTVESSDLTATRYRTTPDGIRVSDTVVGDLNSDGRKDIAVIEAFNGSRIFVFYQDAAGAFGTSQVITTDLELKGLRLGDMNNDGLVDLIVSGIAKTDFSDPRGRVAVCYQDAADHTLGSPVYHTLSSSAVGPLDVADLNSDGIMDIVTAGRDAAGSGVLSLLFQTGGGTLASAVSYTSVTVASEREVHIADMNNDGRNDIVLQSNTAQLAIIRQTAAGVFSTAPEYYATTTSSGSFRSFALGDLNNDGLTDMVVADNGNNGSLNIFLQNAGGTMTGPVFRTVTFNTQDEVDIADMNNDGLNDLVVLSSGNKVYTLLQAGDHTFLGPSTRYIPTATSGGTVIHQAMTIVELTGDGLPEIVASWMNEGIYVLLGVP